MTLANRVSRCRRAAVAAVLVAMACQGCSSPGDTRTVAAVDIAEAPTHRTREASTSKAEQDLQRGIRSYEEADYEHAARQLRSALNRGLRAPEDKMQAYKYLAFVDCASGRIRSCRSEFRNALQVDPKFELAPAEAGHPVWGPVFRNAKMESTSKARMR